VTQQTVIVVELLVSNNHSTIFHRSFKDIVTVPKLPSLRLHSGRDGGKMPQNKKATLADSHFGKIIKLQTYF